MATPETTDLVERIHRFIVRSGDDTYVVEAKGPVVLSFREIRDAWARLAHAVEELGASAGLLVVPDAFTPTVDGGYERVRTLRISDVPARVVEVLEAASARAS